MRTAIRIVLKPLYNAWNAVLVALEINDAVTLFVTAALVPHRDATVVVTTTLGRLLLKKRTVRLTFVQTWRLDCDDETASC
jgi:hypothetical protein